MRDEARESSTRDHSRMNRVLGVVTVVFWASAALMAVLVLLSWVAPGVREALSFNLLGGTCAGLAVVSSAFLFCQELRANSQEMRGFRRERRDISVEEGNEWSSKGWL